MDRNKNRMRSRGFGIKIVFAFCVGLMLIPMLSVKATSSENSSSQSNTASSTSSEPERHLGYLTYDGVISELQRIQSEHPDIAKMYNLGKSIEKRDIWAMKVSDNVAVQENEPEVFYCGVHHAREWPTHEIVMHYLNFLVDNYGKAPEDNDMDLYINEDPFDAIDNDGDGLIDEDWQEARITWIVKNRQLWFVPVVNPDGLEYSQTVNNMWRKNRRQNPGGSWGVDNNRNYGYMWGYDDYGSSPWGWAEDYRGTAPFSEPENQAIRDLVEAHNFKFSLSYHTYGRMILYPWGYIDADTPDHNIFVKNAVEMQKFNGYAHGNPKSGLIYNTNGDLDDYMYGNLSCISYTFEVGTQFQPPYSEVAGLCKENLGPNLYLSEFADNPTKTNPVISHTPLKDTTDTTGPYVVKAVVTSEVGLASNMPALHYKIGLGSYVTVTMLPTGTPNEYYANIPGQPANTDVCYYIEAVDTQGHTTLNPTYHPEEKEYKFHVGPDIYPPEIIHHPLQNTLDTIGPYRVKSTITDNFGSLTTKYTYYSIAGAPYVQVDMSPSTRPDQYFADIPGQPQGTIIDYYIESTDAASPPNTGRHPSSGAHRFKIVIPPIADAGPDQESFSGRTVNFDGSNSYDEDGYIVNWTWNFGDGSIGYGQTTSHVYSSYGIYTVVLTVKDNDGATATDTAVITIWEYGHDFAILSVSSPQKVGLGTTKAITVVVKNVGSFYDYGKVTLYITAPDSTQRTIVQIVKDRDGTSVDPGSRVRVKFYVTFDQVGDWYFKAHVDISDVNGNINPFPAKDCNPSNNDGEPMYATKCVPR